MNAPAWFLTAAAATLTTALITLGWNPPWAVQIIMALSMLLGIGLAIDHFIPEDPHDQI